MKKVLFRFLAYLVAGLSVGGSVRIAFSAFPDFAPGTTTLAMSAGAAGLVVAVLLLRRVAAGPSGGIRINSAGTVAAMDAVCFIASAISAFFLLDGYSLWLAGRDPVIGDALVADVILVMYLPAGLLLAYFVTTTGGQSVAVDETGLAVAGPFGTRRVAWDGIARLYADAQYVLVSRVGLAIPRHLRTNLAIDCGDAGTLRVYQPEFGSVSREILDRFDRHAPSRLRGGLDEVRRNWL